VSKLSIRARITLGSLAIATVLFGAALWFVHGQVTATLRDADATLAATDLASYTADILANPTEPVDSAGVGVLVYVRSPDGSVDVDTIPHEVREVVQKRAAAVEVFDVGHDDTGYVVVGRSVETPAGTWALWSARSTGSTELALRGLDRILIIGGLVLLAGFAVASWWLASAALRPVTRLRRGAELLASDPDGADLLPVGSADDEITDLALTLNDFLSTVRSSMEREKQMISDAAHELRTPIAVLKTQLELARDDLAPDSPTAAQLASAERSADRLGSLASNLLELSRLEQTPETQSHTAIAEIVDEFLSCVDRARLMALARGIDVGFDLDDRAGSGTSSIGLSTASFGRLCDNLVANAIAACTARFDLTLRVDNSVDLVVRDDGKGMPAEFVAHAFERFTRSDKSRSTGGSGLGLSLVAAIASSAGGSVDLENSTSGLTVRVRLPKM
jgi:two-component system, OmpR family, sensor kinase